MFGILARLLEFLYTIWPSYAGSIVLFTLVVMIVLAPLTLKSTRSMLAMQALQPEMKKLQNRYKDDRQKLNEEMMNFYKENKISPLGGCLPMFIQLPVFFILYDLLLNLTRRGPFGGDLGTSMACHLQNGAACVNNVFTGAGHFDPRYLSKSSKLYESLSHTRTMSSWGLDLSQSPVKAFGAGAVHALPYVLMVLVVVVLTYLQQMQIQSRAPQSSQNPTQQLTMKIMPVAMGVIYVVIPAGVVVYFLVSSLFRIGQQALVTRTFYTGPNAVAIPTTAVETSGGPIGEKKSFWKQFVPSESSLPQVKKAERVGGGESERAAGQAKRPAKGAKAGVSSGSSKSSGQSRSSSGKTRPSTEKSQANGQKSAKASKSVSGATEERGDETSAADQSNVKKATSAPSRRAPTRKGPTPPNTGQSKKK